MVSRGIIMARRPRADCIDLAKTRNPSFCPVEGADRSLSKGHPDSSSPYSLRRPYGKCRILPVVGVKRHPVFTQLGDTQFYAPMSSSCLGITSFGRGV